MYRFLIEFGVLEKRWNGAYYKHMDKVVNEVSQWNKWVKDMKQIKVVKRRGQNEHLKQGDEQKQIYILK